MYSQHNRGDEYKEPSGSKDANVGKEVNELLSKAFTSNEAWLELKKKYGAGELANAIYDEYKRKWERIIRRASKFREYIVAKYGPRQLSYSQLMKKAKKYKDKYKISNEEFELFKHLLLNYETHRGDMAESLSIIGRTLGADIAFTTDKMSVTPKDAATLEEIKKLHAETKGLHNQVVLQSLTYSDLAHDALVGSFDRTKQNGYSFVHPVLAAMFLPKIELFEKLILFSNIGYIIEQRLAGKRLLTSADGQLYVSMVYDKNDYVCDIADPVKDLHKRYLLQTLIYDQVIKLRQGNYYYDFAVYNKFMGAIDACRGNIYDSPNLAYIKDEGTILRKILSSFSIRPITLQMNKLYPYGNQGMNYYMPTPDAYQLANVTKVPMIVFSLPYSAAFVGQGQKLSIHQQFMSQAFIENKMIVQKTVSILDVDEVLIYYVPRRQHTINPNIYYNCNYSMLPLSISGWQKMNSVPVDFDNVHAEAGYNFYLRSVVLIGETEVKTPSGVQRLITGCKTVVYQAAGSTGVGSAPGILYDPQGSVVSYQDPSGQYKYNAPVTQTSPGAVTDDIKTHGTIFIYQRAVQQSCVPETPRAIVAPVAF